MDRYNIEYWRQQLDDLWLEKVTIIHKGKDINQAIEQSFIHLISDELRLNNSNTSDFKRLVNTWLCNSKQKKNGLAKIIDNTNRQQAIIDSLYPTQRTEYKSLDEGTL